MLNTGKLAGKTIYITGASRGIGKAMALKAAKDGAKIVVAAKTAEPHPKLPGTIYTAAQESKDYHLDLKNGSGSYGSGCAPNTADVTFIMDKTDFSSMFKGELKPQNAFMSGKLKLKGDVAKALTLDKLMSQVRSYHTSSGELKPATAFMTGKLKLSGDLSKAMALEAVMKASRGEASFHTSAAHYNTTFTSVPQIFERISGVASAEIVGKVKSVYIFDVEGEGKYFIDFKNGDGAVGSGELPSSVGKADVTIKMTSENLIKMFNRELAPASAFMTGKIKVSGDLSKALTLESVMKAAAAAKENK